MNFSPTQSTPGGCLIALIAILPASLFGIGVWGLVKWIRLPEQDQHVNAYFWAMLGAIIVGGLCSVLLLWLARRMLSSTDFRDYDSRDSDKTNLKW